jgi:hypothetical protein
MLKFLAALFEAQFKRRIRTNIGIKTKSRIRIYSIFKAGICCILFALPQMVQAKKGLPPSVVREM